MATAFLIMSAITACFAIVTMAVMAAFIRQNRTLNALRASCFITTERGYRVKHTNATPAQKARAETPRDA